MKRYDNSELEAAHMGSPLLLLKKGSDAPPFFITHGLGGRVTELARIVQFMNTPGPIYGLQWRGWDGQELPHGSIDEMAVYFEDAIIALYPDGPYLLAGLSVGGLPMLEVARRLVERNDDVALLAFLDTYPHPSYWPMGCWIGTMGNRAAHHASIVTKMPLRSAVPQLVKLSINFWSHLQSRRGASTQANTISDPGASEELQRMREQALTAVSQYRPQYYPGNISFLKADIATRFPKDPARIWDNLVAGLEVHTLPSDHVGMISTHAEQVAACLSGCISRALNRSLLAK